MSYLTDRARAQSALCRDAVDAPVPGQMFADVVARMPASRRGVLRGGLGAAMATFLGSGLLAACGGSDDDDDGSPSASYEVRFERLARGTADAVAVPGGYSAELLFAAGDPVAAGAAAFAGSFLSSADTERFAGGNHDGMHFYALPGVDANSGGLLAINHEYPDFQILRATDYDAANATAEEKRVALSAVGVSVIEVARASSGTWSVVAGSRYNRRYSGNTLFGVSGPAAAAVGATVVGTLNNCASGQTPWGTYLTCEESTENYLDPTQPENGYGWVVEIDPQGELAGLPVKRTALGRFDHENTACRVGSDNSVAIYMGDDGTPGCFYKFVPGATYNAGDRAANTNLLDAGTLYAARFNADGTGEWLALVQGQNGLTVGAIDPGNETQGAQADTPIDFATQADVLLNTKAAARVAGATLMDRPEWITVAPDGTVYATCTNNSSRAVTDAANPRVQNRHGHIVRWTETGNVPDATSFDWSIVLQAGDPSLTSANGNLAGNIDGDTFSSPDGIDVDPQGRMWVQTDMSIPGNSGVGGVTNVDVFGHNAMYYIDPASGASTRFLVGPVGCEITGLTYTPDLRTFFINIQHPSGQWPSSVQGNTLPPRSATVVVRRTDGQPVGN
jgi:secreted PhoX family phosphatase